MRPRLLILDDQTQYLRSLERALRGDFDLGLAASLTEALDKCSDDISVALTDIRLDESNNSDRMGLEFIREARRRFPYLPIVAMSALDAPDLEEGAFQAGANRFLRKPIVVSELRELLKELTGAKT